MVLISHQGLRQVLDHNFVFCVFNSYLHVIKEKKQSGTSMALGLCYLQPIGPTV